MPESKETKRKKSIGARVVGIVAGFPLACTCLLLLGLLTWLGTLEQVDHTLLATTKKYFNYRTLYLFPEFNDKTVPIPLPNGFWVGLVFFFNLLLGTILRVRKSWKQVGILISHSGMLLLLLSAFVTQVWSKRGNMAIDEGETSNVAQHYTDHVIEVSETAGGSISRVHVIGTKHLVDLKPEDERLFRMKGLPFDVMVQNYHRNAMPHPEEQIDLEPGDEVIDGFVLRGLEPDKKEAERDLAGCHARIASKGGELIGETILLSSACVHPATFKVEDKVYTITIRKALWTIPFDVQLDKFTHEFHPGTRRPRVFKSEITRVVKDEESEKQIKTEKLIEMNHPMRYRGFTFFQASWGPQDDPAATEFYSVFEVVKNPADHGPLVALIITGFGLFVHFVMKLVLFIVRQIGRNA